MTQYRGSCLCGAVQYRVAGEFGALVLCHCRSCRKASGSAFAANAPVPAAAFEIVAGAGDVREYESSPGKRRAFCSHCGSPLYARLDAAPDTVRIRVGTLDTPFVQRPVAHVFAAEQAPWDERLDELVRHPARAPGD